MYQRKPRARRLWSTLARFYNPIDAEQHIYATESDMPIRLHYYSDGSTRIHGEKVTSTERIPGRADLVNLLSTPRRALLPVRTSISADDWKAHQNAIKAYQKANPQ
jgi:hypothetical protein